MPPDGIMGSEGTGAQAEGAGSRTKEVFYMTRTEKEQEIRRKLENLEQLSDISIDILFGFLHDQGGDAK